MPISAHGPLQFIINEMLMMVKRICKTKRSHSLPFRNSIWIYSAELHNEGGWPKQPAMFPYGMLAGSSLKLTPICGLCICGFLALLLCIAKTYFIELHTACINSFSYRKQLFLAGLIGLGHLFTTESSKASKINSKWLFLNYDFIFRNYNRIDFYAKIPTTQRDERKPYVKKLKPRNQSREKTTQISIEKDHLRRRTLFCSTRKNKEKSKCWVVFQ